jgi:hypothetical protein
MDECVKCVNLTNWWKQYDETVDDIILHSNVHKCSASLLQDKSSENMEKTTSHNHHNGPKGCINKHGICKARFPCDLFPETIVDTSDGHI